MSATESTTQDYCGTFLVHSVEVNALNAYATSCPFCKSAQTVTHGTVMLPLHIDCSIIGLVCSWLLSFNSQLRLAEDGTCGVFLYKMSE